MGKKIGIVVWAIVYGSLAGVIYKILGSFQYLYSRSRQCLWLWKKYPKRCHAKHKAKRWLRRLNDSNWHFADAISATIDRQYPNEPFPTACLISYALCLLLIIPFSALTGLIQGPLFLLKEYFPYDNP